MTTAQWITNITQALRVAGTLGLLRLGFSPTDIMAILASASVAIFSCDDDFRLAA